MIKTNLIKLRNEIYESFPLNLKHGELIKIIDPHFNTPFIRRVEYVEDTFKIGRVGQLNLPSSFIKVYLQDSNSIQKYYET